MDTTSTPAIAHLDIERIVATTEQLIGTPSVNPFDDPARVGFREQEVAEVYATMLRDAGLTVSFDEAAPGRPNVIGTLSGSRPGPTLLFAGHLDTVGVNEYLDPFVARRADGRVYGRGSCDMKGALAVFVDVARAMAEVDFAGTLMVAGIADEEDRMIGSLRWAEHGPTPDFAIVGEPTSLAVCPAHKGQFGAKIRTFGTAVHSSIRETGVNAIEKMSAIIQSFADYNDELQARPHHPLVGHGSFSVGVIRGGEILSTVPDFCEMEIDRRMIPGETTAGVLEELRSRIDSVADGDPELRYELEGPTMAGGVLDTPIDHAIVTHVAGAVHTATGNAATVEAFTGATDAPNFGCPAVICGPGAIAQAHSLDEFVEIAELEAAAHVYVHAALALLAD